MITGGTHIDLQQGKVTKKNVLHVRQVSIKLLSNVISSSTELQPRLMYLIGDSNYSDAYGGQRSMGTESYEGGIGGFVFVCPVSGTIKTKIYSTLEQYPAVLYQVLQEIESEGYVCREIYCDTSSVNLSQSVEEVAEMFKVKIIPISGRTPQELAYVESAVRTLGQMSRSLMLGAPHLPLFVWGMSDLYAAAIHRTIPQKKKNLKSPFEITTGRPPNCERYEHEIDYRLWDIGSNKSL